MKIMLCAKLLQLCLTLYNTMDCTPPGFSVHGIFQARVLEWGAITFSAYEASYMQMSPSRIGKDCFLHLPSNGPLVIFEENIQQAYTRLQLCRKPIHFFFSS